MCRVCFEGADNVAGPSDPGGCLLSPCACSGSASHIHRRCLYAWQQAQRRSGAGDRAKRCEVRPAVPLPLLFHIHFGAGVRRRNTIKNVPHDCSFILDAS